MRKDFDRSAILLPLVLFFGLIIFYVFDFERLLNWENIAKNFYVIEFWATENLILAYLSFFFVYFVSVSLSIPIASLLSMAGGAVFGWPATFPVILGATFGSWIVFYAARGIFSVFLNTRASPFLSMISDRINTSSFLWVFILRLIPIVPFWAVNIISGLLGVRSTTYILATLIGIIPGSIIYVSIGQGIKNIVGDGHSPDFPNLLESHLAFPVIAIFILFFVGLIVRKKWKKN